MSRLKRRAWLCEGEFDWRYHRALLLVGFACMVAGLLASCSSKTSSTIASLTAEDERMLEQVVKDQEGRGNWAAMGLPVLDQVLPETSLKPRWPLYTQVEQLAKKYGLENLASVLINHERRDFRGLGIDLAAYHRLIGLKPDLIKLLKKTRTAPTEIEQVLGCLAQTGARLEDVLSDIEDRRLKCKAVGSYARIVDFDPSLQGMVYSSMDALLKDSAQSPEVRESAWGALAAARRPFSDSGAMWYTDQGLLSMARQIKVSERIEAGGWVDRLWAYWHAQGVAEASKAAFAEEQVARLSASGDKVVRVEAACTLLLTEQGQPKALPILIGLVPEFNEPLPIWGSIGYRAIRALGVGFEQGAFLRNALDGLPSEQQRRLMSLVGREEIPSPEEMVRATIAFLGPESKANTKAKVQVAQIVASALSRELDRRSSR